MDHGTAELYIGLMSGTSMDAVDGVVAGFGPAGNLIRTLASASVPMPDDFRRLLGDLQSSGPDELAAAALVANGLADLYAKCVRMLLAQAALPASAVTALGAHGQTVRHDPQRGYTLQLINAARLAEATGIDTVSDLRSADVAAGGEGAPLVPAFHARVFGGTAARRGITNIGGIANITILEPADTGGSTRSSAGTSAPPVLGYDTGPGNTLMDAWCEQHRGERFDCDGRWAAAGQVDTGLLQRMRAEAYFGRQAPKSTGRDLFNAEWLQRQDLRGLTPVDVQASLLELTATTLADGCRLHQVTEVFVCGGGAANGRLMDRLQANLPSIPVRTTGDLGLDPQTVEATAFAWLARQRVKREPGNLPAVTGASGYRVLGALYPSGSREG